MKIIFEQSFRNFYKSMPMQSNTILLIAWTMAMISKINLGIPRAFKICYLIFLFIPLPPSCLNKSVNFAHLPD